MAGVPPLAELGLPKSALTPAYTMDGSNDYSIHKSDSGVPFDCKIKDIADVSDVPNETMENRFNNELPLTANRNGTWVSCMYHNVTAMLGAGVLGLPSTFTYLGWGGGLVVLIAACIISWYTFVLLCYMHEQPVPDSDRATADGKGPVQYQRMNRYIELSNYALGPRWGWIIQPFQVALLAGIAITYTVTGGQCLHQVYLNNGGNDISLSIWIVIFSSVCLILSQLRNFGEFFLVSAMGAIVTIGYVLIGIIMSGKYPAEPRSAVSYSTGPGESPIGMMFGTFNALTTVCFAFGGHNIALEIQASLPGGTTKETSTIKRMLVGVHVAFIWTTIAYLLVTIVGFWAYGNAVAGNVIFSIGGETWVQSLASMFVVLHVLASYQVYSFPLYDLIEHKVMNLGINMRWWTRVIIRTCYVICTALIACLLPFFGDLMGLVGALGVTPTTFVYPCVLWLILRKPSIRKLDWWYCWFIIITISIVGLLGTIGSLRSIIVHASGYKVFQ